MAHILGNARTARKSSTQQTTPTNIGVGFVSNLIVIGLVALFFLGGHFADVGLNFRGKACNGFFCLTTDWIYHLGWYLQYATFIIMTILVIKWKK